MSTKNHPEKVTKNRFLICIYNIETIPAIKKGKTSVYRQSPFLEVALLDAVNSLALASLKLKRAGALTVAANHRPGVPV